MASIGENPVESELIVDRPLTTASCLTPTFIENEYLFDDTCSTH